jgi:hypothetical protein
VVWNYPTVVQLAAHLHGAAVSGAGAPAAADPDPDTVAPAPPADVATLEEDIAVLLAREVRLLGGAGDS